MKCELCGNTNAHELEDAGHPTIKLYQCKWGFGCREWERRAGNLLDPDKKKGLK
jgi:hypothetical protein